MRIDHLIDEPLARRDKRIGEPLLIFRDLLRALLRAQPAKDDLYRALGPHHRDLRRLPGVVQIAAQVF